MIKKYIFSVENLLDEFHTLLSNYIGPAAFYLNNLWLAERGIELILFGQPLGDPNYIKRYLENLKLTTDATEELSNYFNSSIYKLIFSCVHDYDPTHAYDYEVTGMGDVVIRDLGVATELPTVNVEERFLKEINLNILNGDFVPEKLRRLVSAI